MRLILLLPIILCSCTTAGMVARTPKGGFLALGPTSFLGDQNVTGYKLATREGDTIEFATTSTENPSKNATDIIKKMFYWEAVRYSISTLADLQKLRDAAAHTEKLKEFDLAAQQQGFAHELEMLKNMPIE